MGGFGELSDGDVVDGVSVLGKRRRGWWLPAASMDDMRRTLPVDCLHV